MDTDTITTDGEIVAHLTDTYRSLYLFHGDGDYWAGTVVIDDDRPRMADHIYDGSDRHAYLFLDGTNLQITAYGDSRREVLDRLVATIADADRIIAEAES